MWPASFGDPLVFPSSVLGLQTYSTVLGSSVWALRDKLTSQRQALYPWTSSLDHSSILQNEMINLYKNHKKNCKKKTQKLLLSALANQVETETSHLTILSNIVEWLVKDRNPDMVFLMPRKIILGEKLMKIPR